MIARPTTPRPPNKAQLRIIRCTWERVTEKRLPDDNPNVSASYAFGQCFYEALFKLDPELKPFFTNTVQQARVLTGILSYIARSPSIMPARFKEIGTIKEMIAMDDDEELSRQEEAWMIDQLHELGARHVEYKIYRETMFDHIGPALVEALIKRLDSEYEPHVGEAWLKAHFYVAFHMKRGLQSQLVWENALADDQHFQHRRQERRRSSGASSGGSAAKANSCTIQ
ncbi:hypothetical protein BJV82DRAFT_612349 [Fennellomyces sp. T-0311]|nr:hypothetical protein BJV82DRAFT_612349 [Fennellomyces sp. T-0311]